MRRVYILSLVVLLLVLASCHKHENQQGSLTLKFNPMFGSENLVLNKIYSTPDGKYYYFSIFQLYLSHIKLIRSDASMVEVNPWVFIAVDDSGTLNIPLADSLGSFTGIQFSIGVDSMQNTFNPTTFTNPNLAISVKTYDMYWGTAQKYVFVELQGAADQNTTPQQELFYHIGTEPYYTTIQTKNNFSVLGGVKTVLTLNTNIEQIFYGTSGSINVLKDNYTESQTDGMGADSVSYTTVAHEFMTDFSQTFSLQ